MSGYETWDEIGDDPAPVAARENSGENVSSAEDVTMMKQLAEEILAGTREALERQAGVEQVITEIREYLTNTPAGGAWCWRYLDAYESVALFVELRDWVDWMSARYEVRSIIRPCWFRHGPVVEELTGLYVSWRATFKEQPRVYSDEITAFHDRWFWPFLRRVEERKWFIGCNGTTHKEPSVAMPGTDSDVFEATMATILDGTVAGEDAEAVHAALGAGEALALRDPIKDPTTPVFWRGSWWAILGNSPDGRWVPRPAHVAQKLQALYDENHPKKDS